MRFSRSTQLAAVAVLVGLTGPAAAADNAVSVSTLDFKNRFVQSGIVPEVIAALDPAVSFYAGYMADDGHLELLVPGTSLSVNGEDGATPDVAWHGTHC